ncbi:MAG: GNAT family N-acetyltransferase [bacterium]
MDVASLLPWRRMWTDGRSVAASVAAETFGAMIVQIRSYDMGDESEVVKLWNLCLLRDTITPRRFEDKVLLDPNFDPDGCRLAYEDEKLVGFALAIARSYTWWHYPLQEDRGWIVAIFVHPDRRRRGIGSALLEEALGFLRSRDRRMAILSDYSPNYFLPGPDPEAYPGSVPFFEKCGFRVEDEVVGMGRPLYDFTVPREIWDTEENLQREGIHIEYFGPEYILPTINFFKANFPNWSYYFYRKMTREDPSDEIVIALKDREVIGYCQQLEGDHVGPFGVADAFRNRKIGTVMLYKLLERMRQKEHKFAWFSMTERARSYYERAGFIVTRKHFIMVKDL